MKVLSIYNSLTPQSVSAAAADKLLYADCTLKDILAIETADITTWIGTLSAVYDLILIRYSVTTAGTGVISPAQQILLDAKRSGTVLKTGQATASSSTNTLTQSTLGAIVNEYQNKYVKTTGGTGLNQVRKITANSATVLTLESAWTVGIDNTTTFQICESLDDFSYSTYATSGNLKQAAVMWNHAKSFPNAALPLFIYKLAGDKTTASTAENTQNALDEGYIIAAAKYFLRDLTDDAVLEDWKSLLFGSDPIVATAKKFYTQDIMGENSVYNKMYTFGKLLKESSTALSVTI